MFKCCAECQGMKAPDSESSKHLDIFSGSLHNIKFNIFNNTSKCSTHGLRPFKYKNIYELCKRTQDKEKEGITVEYFLNSVYLGINERDNNLFLYKL